MASKEAKPTFGDLVSAAKDLPGHIEVRVAASRGSYGAEEIQWSLYWSEGTKRLYEAPRASALLEIIESLLREESGAGMSSVVVAEQIAAVRL